MRALANTRGKIDIGHIVEKIFTNQLLQNIYKKVTKTLVEKWRVLPLYNNIYLTSKYIHSYWYTTVTSFNRTYGQLIYMYVLIRKVCIFVNFFLNLISNCVFNYWVSIQLTWEDQTPSNNCGMHDKEIWT